jgi:arylsulfatase A-like enzyme
VQTATNWKLDGVNLLPYLAGNCTDAPHETLYWRMGQQIAVRHGDWKLVRYDSTADCREGGAVTPPRLYHLAVDVGESDDLAARQPDKLRQLQDLWQAWNAQLVEPLWGPLGM